MIVRIPRIRESLRRDGVQVSEDAVAAVAVEVQRFAEDLAQRTLAAFDAHNEARRTQRLDELRRVTAEHVDRARRADEKR